MKKLSFIAIAMAAMTIAGCQLEKEIDSPSKNYGDSTVTASRELSTRSFLQANGEGETKTYEVYWSAPDQILLTYAGGTPSLYNSLNTEPAQTAQFLGTFPKGEGSLYGLYPAEDGNAVDADGNISIQFHAEQTAVAGSYDPLASPAVAVSESKDLTFYNVCGLLELTVGWDDVTSIALSGEVKTDPVTEVPDPAVPFEAAFFNPIPGGVLTVKMDGEPSIEEWSEELNKITLLPPSGAETFSQEETYYMAVPPCSFSAVSMIVTRAEGEETIIFNDVSVERAKVHKVPTLYVEPVVPVESIELDADAIELEEGAEPFTIEATVGPEEATDKTLSWESSDTDVVTVDADGLVTVVGYGEATVTATANDGSGVSASVTITVLPKNRISYDGGETWAPLEAAHMYYYEGETGLQMMFAGDSEIDWESICRYEYYPPACDWFGIDIDQSMLGDWELPQEIVGNDWYCYMSWKGLPVDGYYSSGYSEEVDSGSLSINVESDLSSVDFAIDVEYEGQHVIAIYSGPVTVDASYLEYYYYNYMEEYLASEDEIEDLVAGEYELENHSVAYSYDAVDYLTIEPISHGVIGAVLITGTIADIPVEIHATFEKYEGDYYIYIPGYGEVIYSGIVDWYDEENAAEVYIGWLDSEYYLDSNNGIILYLTGVHELSLGIDNDYILLLDDIAFDIVDLLDPASFVFTYQGPAGGKAPSLAPKAMRAPRTVKQGQGMLKPEAYNVKAKRMPALIKGNHPQGKFNR